MSRIENKPSFVLGSIILCLAIITIFLPVYYRRSIDSTFHFIAIIISINAGVFLLMGSIWTSSDLTGTGFLFGICSWFPFIIINIWGILYGLDWRINQNNWCGTGDISFNILFELGLSLPVPVERIIIHIIQICLTAANLVLGFVSFVIILLKERHINIIREQIHSEIEIKHQPFK